MHANLCIYYEGCRYQQASVFAQKEYKALTDACVANQVRCNDEKTDMEKQCPFFRRIAHAKGR